MGAVIAALFGIRSLDEINQALDALNAHAKIPQGAVEWAMLELRPICARFDCQLVDSAWPAIIVKLTRRGSISEEGARLMNLENAILAEIGLKVEVYTETATDTNKPRAEVAQRVKEWNERRQALRGAK